MSLVTQAYTPTPPGEGGIVPLAVLLGSDTGVKNVTVSALINVSDALLAGAFGLYAKAGDDSYYPVQLTRSGSSKFFRTPEGSIFKNIRLWYWDAYGPDSGVEITLEIVAEGL